MDEKQIQSVLHSLQKGKVYIKYEDVEAKQKEGYTVHRGTHGAWYILSEEKAGEGKEKSELEQEQQQSESGYSMMFNNEISTILSADNEMDVLDAYDMMRSNARKMGIDPEDVDFDKLLGDVRNEIYDKFGTTTNELKLEEVRTKLNMMGDVRG